MGGKRCRSRCRHWKGDEVIAPANKALHKSAEEDPNLRAGRRTKRDQVSLPGSDPDETSACGQSWPAPNAHHRPTLAGAGFIRQLPWPRTGFMSTTLSIGETT